MQVLTAWIPLHYGMKCRTWENTYITFHLIAIEDIYNTEWRRHGNIRRLHRGSETGMPASIIAF